MREKNDARRGEEGSSMASEGKGEAVRVGLWRLARSGMVSDLPCQPHPQAVLTDVFFFSLLRQLDPDRDVDLTA